MAEVGIAIPNMPGVTPATIPDYARRIEAGGFAAIWTLDRLVYDLPDPITTLAACAAITQRVRVGTSILLLPLYQPAQLAKQLATLDLIANGRVTLGVGIGRRPDDLAAVGVPMKGRGGRAAESIQIMRLVWSGEPVRFQGRHFSIDVGPIGPRPVQRPGIPIWMGGSHDAAVRRAARLGDGFIAGGALGPEGFAALRQRVTQALQDAGRSAAGFPFGCLAYYSIHDDRQRAKEQLMATLTRYYGPQFANVYDPEKLAIFGPPAEFARRAQAYLDAGVEHLILCSTAVDAGQVDRIAREVLPRLRLG